MIKTFLATCVATCAFVVASFGQDAAAQDLIIGSKAPKLELKKFIKGDEVKSFEKGKIYVIELWATWCGPCRTTIPHLTELQKKYKDVTIIGVAVIEEDESAVSEFVEKMGKKMDYRVALDLVPDEGDPNDGKIVKNWMTPAELEGIPSAFIINGEGRIAWIGHPGQMEEPLEQIVDGKWDLDAEAKVFVEARAAKAEKSKLEKKMAESFGRLQKLFREFHEDGDPKGLLEELDSSAKSIPEGLTTFQMIRFQILTIAKGMADEAVELGNQIIESKDGNDTKVLNNLAWIIVDPERDTKADPKVLKLALKVAIKADDIANHEDSSVADTLAKTYFDNNDLAKAVKTQERAVKLTEGTPHADDPGFKKRLRQYKKALSAASNKEADAAEAAPKKN